MVVVDDDEDMRDMMAHLLRERCEVETAEDGAAGLDLVALRLWETTDSWVDLEREPGA